jgi:hypothetical protein
MDAANQIATKTGYAQAMIDMITSAAMVRRARDL